MAGLILQKITGGKRVFVFRRKSRNSGWKRFLRELEAGVKSGFRRHHRPILYEAVMDLKRRDLILFPTGLTHTVKRTRVFVEEKYLLSF